MKKSVVLTTVLDSVTLYVKGAFAEIKTFEKWKKKLSLIEKKLFIETYDFHDSNRLLYGNDLIINIYNNKSILSLRNFYNEVINMIGFKN